MQRFNKVKKNSTKLCLNNLTDFVPIFTSNRAYSRMGGMHIGCCFNLNLAGLRYVINSFTTALG